MPYKITTDCGGECKNNLLEDFCKLHKIELHYTTPKNSNSNSPVERFHSTIAEEIRCLKLDKPREEVNTLMNHAIIGYNNAIHSVTGYTPFEVIKGHINTGNPFELSDKNIITDYIQNHKDKVKLLCDNIKRTSENKKEHIIQNLNAKREEPVTYKPNETVYVKTKNRNKAKPKFNQTFAIADNSNKLTTKQGAYHKSCIKKPRKTYPQKTSFQVHDDSSQNPDRSPCLSPCLTESKH